MVAGEKRTKHWQSHDTARKSQSVTHTHCHAYQSPTDRLPGQTTHTHVPETTWKLITHSRISREEKDNHQNTRKITQWSTKQGSYGSNHTRLIRTPGQRPKLHSQSNRITTSWHRQSQHKPNYTAKTNNQLIRGNYTVRADSLAVSQEHKTD